MAKLHKTSRIETTKENVRLYLSKVDAMLRLAPPWQDIDTYNEEASTRTFNLKEGLLLHFQMIAQRHVEKTADLIHMTDTFMQSPFPIFQHERSLKNATQDGHACYIEDELTYTPPWGMIGNILNPREIIPELNDVMRYQHTRIKEDMKMIQEVKQPTSVLITGSHGFIGRHLKAFLSTLGHHVTSLVRDPNNENSPIWDPDNGIMETTALEGVNTVVHLAGESLLHKRWSEKQKKYILKNRRKSVETIVKSIQSCTKKPKTLIIASAIGYYGDTGEHKVTEDSPAGNDFATEVCQTIEKAVKPLENSGVRVIILRLGIVLNPRGGALAQMMLPFKMGVGGPMGNGKQYMSWIGLEDLLHVFHFVMQHDKISGILNATAPTPITNKEFSKCLARKLKRPCFLSMPKFVVKLLFGEMGRTLLLSGSRVLPTRLENEGFEFLTPTLDEALDFELHGIYPEMKEKNE